MSNLVAYARRELAAELQRTPSEDDPMGHWSKAAAEAVVELVEKFASQGHSGASAPVVVNLFKRLAMFEPLSALTGAEEEWDPKNPGSTVQQNNRCFDVFRDTTTGEAYHSGKYIFKYPSGTCFMCRESRAPITFPYMPSVEYVKLAHEDESAYIALKRHLEHKTKE